MLRSLRDRGGTRQPVALTGLRGDGVTYPAELSASPIPASEALVVSLRDTSALGGRLRAESAPGEGSTFTAWFPDAPPHDDV